MTLFEIPLETFPNQSVSVTINNEEITFQVSTLGDGLYFSAFTSGEPIFTGLRLPINNLLFIRQLAGFLVYTGNADAYNWKTINNPSVLYYLNPISDSTEVTV